MRSFCFIALALVWLISCNSPAPKTTPPPTDSLIMVKEQLSRDSANPEHWRRLYELQLDKGDTAAAFSALQAYTLLQPQDGHGWLELAWLLADMKDPRTVVVADSLQIVPDPDISTRAAYIKGVYYSNTGSDDKALAIFDSLIVRNYTFLDAYIEKGIIQHEKKKFTEALATFMQALKVSSTEPEIYFWISKCHEGLGNTAEADDWRKKYEALR